ncbi:MAG: ribosome small subunit-dependent GTPase A [Pyrinomonadaceae bacterium]|nr:ribosome small subunit-dependent GTPase A [Pyrinomonadaceae bacterium]
MDQNRKNLEKMGFCEWFEDRSKDPGPEAFQPARIINAHKESYTATNGVWTSYAEITGKLMFSAESPLDYPAVGDWCYVQYFDPHSPVIIHEIMPRRSILKRKAAGRKIEFQAIASNIDCALIVQSLNSDFNLRRLERYLVMVREGNIEPVFLLSKSDLLEAVEIEERIDELRENFPDVKLFAFSNSEENTVGQIEEMLTAGKTYCLLGSSGVGKTSLLNNLLGENVFKTEEIRAKDEKGRHATTSRQLLLLKVGAMMIDTPGMRELGNIGVESGIGEVFDDIAELASQCKFSDCSHQQEIGCAILEALEDESISHERYQNYTKMRKESEHHEMSYLERRKKDKGLGKLYKSVQKSNRKNF